MYVCLYFSYPTAMYFLYVMCVRIVCFSYIYVYIYKFFYFISIVYDRNSDGPDKNDNKELRL